MYIFKKGRAENEGEMKDFVGIWKLQIFNLYTVYP